MIFKQDFNVFVLLLSKIVVGVPKEDVSGFIEINWYCT